LPVPRIPPLRLLGGLEAQSERLDGRVEVEWISDQERVAAFETTTNGFTLVNASVAWKPFGNRQETTLLLSANNIFDVEARRHASFTKDYVPLAGRDLRLSLRTSF
jgi:iron complex outermembrane receptor protein